MPAAVTHIHVSTCSFNRKAVLSYNCSDVFKIRPMQQKTETNTNTENANNLVETEAAQELCKSCCKTIAYVLCGRLQRAWEWTGREQIGKKRPASKRKSNFCHRAKQATLTQHPPRPCQQHVPRYRLANHDTLRCSPKLKVSQKHGQVFCVALFSITDKISSIAASRLQPPLFTS